MNTTKIETTYAYTQGVGSVLRAARFRKGERYTTAIRGWYRYYEGYRISNHGNGVLVEYQNGNDKIQTNADIDEFHARWERQIAAMAAALEAAGYIVRINAYGVYVSAKIVK